MKAWLLSKGDRIQVMGGDRDVVKKVSPHENGPPQLRIDLESGRYISCDETHDFTMAPRS